MYSLFLSHVIETLVKVWENSKKLWKHSSAACVPTAFLVLPNFHSCFYNSVETWFVFKSFKSNCKMQLMERDAFLPCGALFVCTLYSVLGTVMHLYILCIGIYL